MLYGGIILEFKNKLEEKGLIFNEVEGKAGDFKKKWEETFLNNISKSQKKKIKIDSFLWHIFSYEKLPCLKGEEAIEAFDKQTKKECYIFEQYEDNAFKVMNTHKLKAKDITTELGEYLSDIYIVSSCFTWTYIVTHEKECGPYFYKKED